MIKIHYNDIEERKNIMSEYEGKGLRLFEEGNLINGNYLVFGEENEQVEQPTELELLKQENADQAFEIMLLEAKDKEQEQEMADLQFNLMLGGVL